MRRPLSLYSPSDVPISTQFGESLVQKSGSYRVLKSQSGGSGPQRYVEQPDAFYGAQLQPGPRSMPLQEPLCAYLTMDLQIAKATQGFGEAVGIQSIVARRLEDIVSPGDREKVLRLQRGFEEERREREPNYLPPIYLKFEEDRVIQGVGFGPDEMSQFQVVRPEVFTFQGPDGQQRTFHVRFGLAKRESTYFIVFLLHVPATTQTYYQPSSSPYSRESYHREPQYGYQTPQPSFAQPPTVTPFVQNTPFGDPRSEPVMGYRPSTRGGNMPANVPQSSVPSYVQGQARPDYVQAQNPYQTPRSELPPQAQPRRTHDLQLPPIRDSGPSSDPRRRDDRSGRVDIGGLLENSEPSRR
ncbi:hypothetical protein PVAG01_08288 [Phlyctema vagabunda]|uniref:Velvet domain-containing protein n=1 Tax=Phlyctema vagabunda TaxID=108571 RepID=A0ABR4P926_9HELO